MCKFAAYAGAEHNRREDETKISELLRLYDYII